MPKETEKRPTLIIHNSPPPSNKVHVYNGAPAPPKRRLTMKRIVARPDPGDLYDVDGAELDKIIDDECTTKTFLERGIHLNDGTNVIQRSRSKSRKFIYITRGDDRHKGEDRPFAMINFNTCEFWYIEGPEGDRYFRSDPLLSPVNSPGAKNIGVHANYGFGSSRRSTRKLKAIRENYKPLRR